MRVSAWQVAIIIVVIVLIFGAPRLPDLARSLGKSLRILRDETRSLTNDGDESASPKGAGKDTKA